MIDSMIRKRRGRPDGTTKEGTRTHRVQVLLNDCELAEITRLASAEKKSVSKYMRDASMKAPV